MIEPAAEILSRWHDYSNAEQGIDCGTEEDFHNTVTPLGWIDPEKGYVLCMMLRNNITAPDRPDGVFHTHPSRFHIKKEGIGIIDAPGLSILPPRLKKELNRIAKLLAEHADKKSYPDLSAHFEWIDDLRQRYSFTEEIFVKMLEDCAVFSRDEKGASAFRGFVRSCLIF